MEEPDSFKKPADWIMEAFTAHQKRVVDTLLNLQESDVPVRIYYPTKKSLNGNQPITLFIHGGGFILGSIDEYHMMVSKLAKITGNIMISVEYRLAPQHPFPAGVMDCFAGTGTTAVACERLGIKWIGIEISEKYCEIAAKRIESEASQLKLFT